MMTDTLPSFVMLLGELLRPFSQAAFTMHLTQHRTSKVTKSMKCLKTGRVSIFRSKTQCDFRQKKQPRVRSKHLTRFSTRGSMIG